MWLPDPFPEGVFYWPEGAPREDTLRGWIAVFETLGYRACGNAELEEGVEKVAIYTSTGGEPQHAARQLASGRWTSKLGKIGDIEHDLSALEGGVYGRVSAVLARPRGAGD